MSILLRHGLLARRIVGAINIIAWCAFGLDLLLSHIIPSHQCGYRTCLPTSLAFVFFVCLPVLVFTQSIQKWMKKNRIGYYKSPIRQRQGRVPLRRRH
jgi:hypothetical protein